MENLIPFKFHTDKIQIVMGCVGNFVVDSWATFIVSISFALSADVRQINKRNYIVIFISSRFTPKSPFVG